MLCGAFWKNKDVIVSPFKKTLEVPIAQYGKAFDELFLHFERPIEFGAHLVSFDDTKKLTTAVFPTVLGIRSIEEEYEDE